MLTTTNYGLKKPELTDSPPDITVTNTNWDAVDTKLKELYDADAAQKTQADIAYYVSTTGNDTTGTGSSGNPFRTIQKAISSLPQIINHTVNINVSAGTYAEDIVISGYTGKGALLLNGSANLANATNYKINRIDIKMNSIPITILGFEATSTSESTFIASVCKFVYFKYCRAIGVTASKHGVLASQGSTVYVVECEISNKIVAIAVYGSIVLSMSNSGSNNSTVLSVTETGIIGKSGTQPAGTTSESQSFGGKIISNNPSSYLSANGYRHNDDGTIEQWGVTTINSISANALQVFSVTFPTTFPNAVLAVNANCWGSVNSEAYVTSCVPMSTSTANITVKNGSAVQNITINWRILGR